MILKYTIKELINDARTALKAEAYFSALSLTFSIISECAKIEYSDKWFSENADTDEYLRANFPSHYKNGKYNCPSHDKERFQMWIDDWENGHNCDIKIKEQMEEFAKKNEENRYTDNGLLPFVNGELLYQLRCVLFHEGSANIEFENIKKISDEGNLAISQNNFVLAIEKNNEFNLYTKSICSKDATGKASLEININSLVIHYLNLAERYFQDIENKNKDGNKSDNKESKTKKFNEIIVNDYRKSEEELDNEN